MKKKFLLLAIGFNVAIVMSADRPCGLQRIPIQTNADIATVKTRGEFESSMEDADPKVLSYLSPDPFYAKTIATIPAQGNKIALMTRYSDVLLQRFKGNRAKRLSMVVAEEAIRVKVFILDEAGTTLFEKEITDLKDLPGGDVWDVGYLWGHEINVDVDFEINDQPFILGYEVEVARTNGVPSIPVIIQNIPTSNVCFVDQFIGLGVSPYFGAPYMMIHTEGDAGLVDYDAALASVAPMRVAVGQNFNEAGTFVNLGTKPISNILFEYTNPDGSQHTYELTSEEPFGYMSTVSFAVPMAGNNVSSSVECPVEISRLDGKSDMYPSDNILNASIISMSAEDAPERTVVVEIATGTWCGYCPRALASIEYLPEYTDTKHIPIEVHVSDQFEGNNIDGYKPYVNAAPGIPYAWVNRNISCDPWQGLGSDPLAYGFGDVVSFIGTSLVELGIDVNGVYDADSGTITLESTTIPAIDLSDSGRYKVGFALLENGLLGVQTNYYSHEKSYPQEYVPEPMMKWWEEKESVLMEYNYTLRSTSGANGSEPLGDGFIAADSTIKNSYTFDAADVNDCSKTIAVAFVFDSLAGEIVNAAQSSITMETGVSEINGEDISPLVESGILRLVSEADIEVYDVSGRIILSEKSVKSVNLNLLKSGIYVIYMTANGKQTSLKVAL